MINITYNLIAYNALSYQMNNVFDSIAVDTANDQNSLVFIAHKMILFVPVNIYALNEHLNFNTMNLRFILIIIDIILYLFAFINRKNNLFYKFLRVGKCYFSTI